MPDYPGGYSYQSPSLPPMSPFPTPFPQELGSFGPLAYMALRGSGLLPPNMMNFSFTPSTDIYTQFQAVQQFQDKTAAMQAATRGDIQTLMRYQESIANATGANWSSLKSRAGVASNWIGSMLPVLSMIMPEPIDMMMGPRGSQTVMAGQMSNLSRFMFDPATGRQGMTGAETGRLTDMLYQQLYGTDTDMLRMRGIGAGRAGILANEMMGRGLLSGSPFLPGGGNGALLGATDIASLVGSGGNLGALGGLAMSSSRLDQARTNQMGEQIRGMAKVVSAISDLFGANGQPNAPMPQLLAALDQLGQGAEYRYGAGQVTSMFRNLQQATITGRISLPQISQMVNQNASILAAVGGDPRDAIAMTQRAVNYAAGASDIFSKPFFGRMDPRTLASSSAALEGAAVNSPAGQMAQVALYLADTSGLGANSEIGQLASAIRNGDTTYAGGKSIFTALQGQNLRNLYRASGGNTANFDAAAMNPEITRQYTGAVAATARGIQFSEAGQLVGGYLAGDMASVFGLRGRRGLAAGSDLVNRVFAEGGRFSGMDAAGQAAEIERLAELSAGAAPGSARGSGGRLLAMLSGGLRQFTGNDLPRALQLFSPEMREAERRRTQANRVNADISEALGDLGRFSFTQRLADELQRLDPKEGVGGVISRVMGGVDKKKIEEALKTSIGGSTLGEGISSSIRSIQNSRDPVAIRALETQMSALKKMLGDQGVSFDYHSVLEGSGSMVEKIISNPMAAISEGFGAGMGLIQKGVGALGQHIAKSKNHITMDVKGQMTIHQDGTATLSGTGTGEGAILAGATGGAR